MWGVIESRGKILCITEPPHTQSKSQRMFVELMNEQVDE